MPFFSYRRQTINVDTKTGKDEQFDIPMEVGTQIIRPVHNNVGSLNHPRDQYIAFGEAETGERGERR
jgi:hypothetical protein